MKEKLVLFSKHAAAVAWEYAKAATPMLVGFAVTCVCVHAGPIVNALTQSGTEVVSGVTTAGVGMIGWQGMRIYMDEHHSVNPGRVVGGLTGSMFAFAPTSLANWAAGW